MSIASVLQEQQRRMVDTRTISERIGATLKHFGLPSWVRRSQPKTVAAKVYPVAPAAYLLPPHVFVVGKPLPGIKLDRPPAEENLLALLEVADLAQPAVTSVKSSILKWLEDPSDKIVTMKEIKAAFPDVPRSTISSRMSELVKSGEVIAHPQKNFPANVFYWLPKAKRA